MDKIHSRPHQRPLHKITLVFGDSTELKMSELELILRTQLIWLEFCFGYNDINVVDETK